MIEELKSCPFCNGVPEMQWEEIESMIDYPNNKNTQSKEVWNLFCNTCGCQQYVKNSRKEAIEAWNKRA